MDTTAQLNTHSGGDGKIVPPASNWEELIDEQIDKIDEGLAIKKDEPNRLGIYTSATNLGTRKIEIKSIIRKEKELSKEEGRREIKRCGKPIEELGTPNEGVCGVRLDCHLHDWRADLSDERARLEVIAQVEEYIGEIPPEFSIPSNTPEQAYKAGKVAVKHDVLAFLSSLKTNLK